MNDIDLQKLERTSVEAEEYYKTIGSVRCPYFNDAVAFNARGFEHIKFKSIRHARSSRDQYIRFRLLKLAPEILGASHTLQGISRRNNMEREKTHGKWQIIMRHVTYYEFIAVIKEEVRVRVIVKQVESGQKFFWSIVPFWKMDKITGGRITHSGKPEYD